ncbi:hypothetical protein HII28_16700 [Planctomonas sp. JC2975]|uniref:hypothetical protein n=1 Tax=Planctomonas sp. JC2975 TaxID=2729626 RepID=UPI0014732B07|nr:hypothetical protein [Planctomonas sp. JC2975]NNC13508.1 hypothetical protein [Planctomonas sp. JC2975]
MSETDEGAGDPNPAHERIGGDSDPAIGADRQGDGRSGYGAPRYGSPRTPQLPRAFTLQEFVGGAARAVFWFQPLGAVTSLVIGLVVGAFDHAQFATIPMLLILSALCGIPVSVAAGVVFSPFAYRLGRRLEHVGRDRAHVIAFTLLGLVVGVITAVLFGLGWSLVTGVTSWSSTFGLSLYVCAYAPASAVTVPLGWWGASRLALRADEERAAWAAVSFVSGPFRGDGSA